MNEHPSDPKVPKPETVAKWVAVAALSLLVLTNGAWLVAYSALSARVIGVDHSLGKTPSSKTSPSPRVSVSPSPSPSSSPSPSATATPASRGTISGDVGYPAETAPAQTVCAVNVSDASVKVCVDHAAGNALAYSLTAPAGTYHVYASLKSPQGSFGTDYKAYYNKYVTCGMTASCADSLHTQYIDVMVPAGGTVTGVNPTDWYAL